MARAIAVCTNGPFEGQAFSIELNEDGTAPELTSRLDLHDGEKAYASVGPLTESGAPWKKKFSWAEHQSVLEYRV